MKRIILASAALAALVSFSAAHADDGKGDDGNENEGKGGSSSSSASGVNAATATGTGQVIVFAPVTVTQTQGLDFGTITSGADGSVAIDADSGSRAVAGGVGAVAAKVGQQGAFKVTGESDAAINVVVGATISGFGGGITGVTAPSKLPTVLNGTSATFAVGGSLKIPANTKAGAYSGSYSVAVNYP